MSLSSHPTRKFLEQWANPPGWANYSEVHLSVYNLSLTATLNSVTNTLGLGGVFHTGVEVYWLEWSYGFIPEGTGVYPVKPKQSTLGSFHSSIPLGHTQLSPWQVMEVLEEMKYEWVGPEYQVFNHNCVCFSAEFARRLGVKPPPEWTDSLAKVGDSYLGWMIAEEEPADAVDVNDDMDAIWEMAQEFILQSLVFECWVDETLHAREHRAEGIIEVPSVQAHIPTKSVDMAPSVQAQMKIESHVIEVAEISTGSAAAPRRQSFLRRTSLSVCATPVCLPSGKEIGVLHSRSDDQVVDDAPQQLVARLKEARNRHLEIKQSSMQPQWRGAPPPARKAPTKPSELNAGVIHGTHKSELRFQKSLARDTKIHDPELQATMERLRGLRGHAVERHQRAWETALESQPVPSVREILRPKGPSHESGGATQAYVADGHTVQVIHSGQADLEDRDLQGTMQRLRELKSARDLRYARDPHGFARDFSGSTSNNYSQYESSTAYRFSPNARR